MNSPPPVTAINQMLLQVVPGVAGAAPSGGTPSAMATIAAGALISGTVFGRDAHGNTQLETGAGMISLKMDLFLKRGVEIVLKMEQVQKEMFARIVSVDGKSLAKYMESIGATVSEQDSIAHSSLMLQTAADKVVPAQTGTATPKELSPLLKAILVSPPLLDEKALEALPPETKLVLLRATVGATLKIEVLKLDLPLHIQGAPPTPQTALPPTTIPQTPLPPQTANPPVPGHPVSPLIAPSSPTPPTTTVPPAALPQTPPPIPTAAPPVAPGTLAIPPTATAPASAPHPFIDTAPESPLAAPNSPLPPQASAPASPPTQATAATPVALAHEELIPFLQNQTLSHILNAAPALTPQPPVPASAVTLLQEATSPPPQANTPPVPGAASLPSPAAYNSAKPEIPIAAPPATAPSLPPVTLRADGTPVFTATVIASSSDSQVTLHTPLGTVKLFSPTQLPPGTALSFTLAAVEPADADSEPLSTVPARTFKGLEELTALSHPSATPGTSPVAKLVPRAGAALSSEILFLLTALKGGDVRKWLGETNFKELEKPGKADLLQRITQDFMAMRGSSAAEAPDAQAWTQMTIPFLHDGLHPVQWFQKQGEQRRQEGKDPKKSSFDEHFVVDFHLTQLGHMQLDGLIKRESQGYSFDLTIRSENGLSPDMQQHIKEIYAQAQAIGGFRGLILFRSGLDACVPLESLKTAGRPPSASHSILA